MALLKTVTVGFCSSLLLSIVACGGADPSISDFNKGEGQGKGSFMNYLMVFFGGGLGAALRYGLNVGVPRVMGAGFPWATFIVNIVGCFVMGAITAFLRTKMPEDETLRLFLTTGLMGGFTTFSAFSLDFFNLMQKGQMPVAVVYALASAILSIIAVMIGFRLLAS